MHRCHIKKAPKVPFSSFSSSSSSPYIDEPALSLSPVCIKATPLPLILISCCPRPPPRGLYIPLPPFLSSPIFIFSSLRAHCHLICPRVVFHISLLVLISFSFPFYYFFLHLCFEICRGEKRVTKRRECNFFLTVKRKNNKGTKRKDAGIASPYYSSPVLNRST